MLVEVVLGALHGVESVAYFLEEVGAFLVAVGYEQERHHEQRDHYRRVGWCLVVLFGHFALTVVDKRVGGKGFQTGCRRRQRIGQPAGMGRLVDMAVVETVVSHGFRHVGRVLLTCYVQTVGHTVLSFWFNN